MRIIFLTNNACYEGAIFVSKTENKTKTEFAGNKGGTKLDRTWCSDLNCILFDRSVQFWFFRN